MDFSYGKTKSLWRSSHSVRLFLDLFRLKNKIFCDSLIIDVLKLNSNFRFYARDSGLLRFKIYAGLQNRNSGSVARRLVAFTLHPSDPFVISVQRTNAEYVVNLHVRHFNL